MTETLSIVVIETDRERALLIGSWGGGGRWGPSGGLCKRSCGCKRCGHCSDRGRERDWAGERARSRASNGHGNSPVHGVPC